jgi:hypothetical protein
MGERSVRPWSAPVAAIAVVLLLSGCSSPVPEYPPEWKGRDLTKPVWTNTTLEPDWSLVLEYPLPGSAKLAWDWFTNSSGYAYFQVVKMEGKQADQMVAKHSQDEAAFLTTPTAGVYQIIWINDGFMPMDLTWDTSEGYSERTYPPGEGPGCVFLLC